MILFFKKKWAMDYANAPSKLTEGNLWVNPNFFLHPSLFVCFDNKKKKKNTKICPEKCLLKKLLWIELRLKFNLHFGTLAFKPTASGKVDLYICNDQAIGATTLKITPSFPGNRTSRRGGSSRTRPPVWSRPRTWRASAPAPSATGPTRLWSPRNGVCLIVVVTQLPTCLFCLYYAPL